MPKTPSMRSEKKLATFLSLGFYVFIQASAEDDKSTTYITVNFTTPEQDLISSPTITTISEDVTFGATNSAVSGEGTTITTTEFVVRTPKHGHPEGHEKELFASRYRTYRDPKGGMYYYDSFGQYYIPSNLTLDEKQTKKFRKALLSQINKYREGHAALPLTLDEKITGYSQWWADVLFKRNELFVSAAQWRPTYGESIHWTGAPYVPARLVADGWYVDGKDYNYTAEPDADTMRKKMHFVQMIWKSSRKIGIGVAGDKHNFFVVVNYEPKGAIPGQYVDNLLPPDSFVVTPSIMDS